MSLPSSMADFVPCDRLCMGRMECQSESRQRPAGVQEVMGLIPVGDSDFSLSHARVMLNIPSFTSNYRAQNSPPSFTYHNFVFVNIIMPWS